MKWLLPSGLLLAGSTALAQAPVREDGGTIRLHYVGHAIGQETYSLRAVAGGLRFEDDFRFNDRGGAIQLVTAATLAADFTPVHFESNGKSYRFINIDARVDIAQGNATVRNLDDSARVRLPARFFTVNGYAPLALQGLLVRYWEAHGRPQRMAILPADPLQQVTIEQRGSDTIRAGAARIVLRRYSVEGVVWGQEAIWLDAQGSFAALLTGSPFLPFEGIREEYADALPQLQASALRDRLRDLVRYREASTPFAEGSYALVGARLIDGTGAPPIANATVIIEGDRITAAGPSARVRVPPGVLTIDVRGKTILPGLWDMHAHISQIEWAPAYLAAGVTTVRDMGGELPFLTAFRDAIEQGRGIGPRLLLAGLVDGSGPSAFGAVTAQTADEARAIVDRYKAAGFTQMKLYTLLTADVVSAITTRAHELGMTVTGHLPRSLQLRHAIESGMDQIAHMPLQGDTASPELKSTIQFLAAHRTAIDPTQSWGEILGHAPETPIAAFQPGYRTAPWPIRNIFGSVRNNTDAATVRTRQQRSLGIVKALHTAGVPVVAGTDGGLPGHSLPREIELYVAAGLTPMNAIRAATAVPAEVMGLSEKTGTVSVGKWADLVVLDADPLEDIRNIRRVHWVITRGRMLEAAPLWLLAGFR